MTEKKTNFFQDHSIHYLEMALGNGNVGRMEHPDGYGKRTGTCGDTVEMYLMTAGDRIENVSFVTDGCMNTHACAAAVAHLSENKTLAEAWKLKPEDVVEFLGTLPDHETHCAELAVGAFYLALASCREFERHPWKRQYPSARK